MQILIIVLPLSALEIRCDLCRACRPIFELPITASSNPWPLLVVMAVSGLFVILTVEDQPCEQEPRQPREPRELKEMGQQ